MSLSDFLMARLCCLTYDWIIRILDQHSDAHGLRYFTQASYRGTEACCEVSSLAPASITGPSLHQADHESIYPRRPSNR